MSEPIVSEADPPGDPVSVADAVVPVRTPELIEARLIRKNGGTQIRAALNQLRVKLYADLYQAGVELDPIEVIYDGADYWIWDGFHREAAQGLIGRTRIHAFVTPGTRRDAIFRATGANGKHGLERTDEDKRRAVWTLLEDDEWRSMTDRAICKHVHVSPSFVGDVRRAYKASVPGGQLDDDNVRTDSRGRKIDTTNIGKTKKTGASASTTPAKPLGPATSLPNDHTPAADKFAVGNWVRAASGHEGEITKINGRNITVQMTNGERDYVASLLTKAARPTGPQLPPPIANHEFMRATLASLYDQHANHNGWVGEMYAKLYEAPALHQAGLIACCRRRAPSGAPIRWWQITPDGCEVLGREPLEVVPEPPADQYPPGAPADVASIPAVPAPEAAAPAAPAPAAPALPVNVTLTLMPASEYPRVANAVLKCGDDIGMRRIVFDDAAALGQAILDAENELPRR